MTATWPTPGAIRTRAAHSHPETTGAPGTTGTTGSPRAARLQADATRAVGAALDRPQILPAPPTDAERDVYLGRQWRWVAPVSFCGYLLIVVSIGFFVYRHPWSFLLVPPMAVTGIGAVVSLVTSSRRRRDTLPGHRAKVESWTPAAHPSVDVFLPSAGEDLDVLRNTYRHVAALDWPGELTVHVLDDSARPEVAELARRHGFVYLSRPDRGHFKKAGNLRYGFDHSAGDLILILDADFVPRPDALRELVPYFDDEQVALVQSPQYFDVDSRMNWLQRAAGATQILFYRWVQPSRDRSNAAICVGTSALYRRSALDEAGGYALIGHSEDVHTGVKLMRAGYRIRYVPTVVTKGLCPDTLDQFMTQQYRWCTGSMSLLFSRSFHTFPLTPMQRLCYWSGFLYYITTAVNVFMMAIPPLLMAWFVASGVDPANYIFVLMAMVVRQTVIPYITLGSESLTGLARIQMTYSFCHAVALVDTLRGRTDSWVATGAKQRSRTADRVSRLIRIWCVGVQVLLWTAIAWFAPVYGWGQWCLMIGFSLLNLYVVLPVVAHSTRTLTVGDLRHRASAWWQGWQWLRARQPQAGLAVTMAAYATATGRALAQRLPDPLTPAPQPAVLRALSAPGSRFAAPAGHGRGRHEGVAA